MYLDSLYYFVSVAELGSVSRAAQKMYTSQQVVSAHIQRLEKYYRAQLIYRTRPITLTLAGERLLSSARTVIDTLENTERQIRELVRQEPNRLVIATGRAASPPFLEKLLRAFQEKKPDAEIALMHPTSTETRWNAPPEGAHILVGEFPFEEELEAVELFHDSYCLALSRSALESCLGAGAAVPKEMSVEQIRTLCSKLPLRLTDTMIPGQAQLICRMVFSEGQTDAMESEIIRSTDLVKYLCRTGQCCSILPAILAAKAFFPRDEIYLISVPELIPPKRIGLGISKRAAEADVVKLFVKTAKELFAPPSQTE